MNTYRFDDLIGAVIWVTANSKEEALTKLSNGEGELDFIDYSSLTGDERIEEYD